MSKSLAPPDAQSQSRDSCRTSVAVSCRASKKLEIIDLICLNRSRTGSSKVVVTAAGQCEELVVNG